MDGKRCPVCGTLYIDEGSRFCPADGAELLVQRTSDGPGPGTLLDGRFLIGDPLGQGAMGTVHFARDRVSGFPVAVKVLLRSLATDGIFVQRFEREAGAAARISHPNVAAVYAQGRDQLHVYLAMEYIEGQSLRALAESGDLGLADVARIGRDIAAGLQAAHAAGVVHRDLKPDNVMVARDGSVKIVDFGVALIHSFEQGRLRLTKTGIRLGSPAYMSPEASRGGEMTAASDIYSLGVVLYEMLAGRPPFESSNPMALAGMHISARPEPLAALRPDAEASGLANLVDGMLEKAPEKRPESAAEVQRRLSIIHAATASGAAQQHA